MVTRPMRRESVKWYTFFLAIPQDIKSNLLFLQYGIMPYTRKRFSSEGYIPRWRRRIFTRNHRADKNNFHTSPWRPMYEMFTETGGKDQASAPVVNRTSSRPSRSRTRTSTRSLQLVFTERPT